jgi:predicted nucleic acid-binding protein
VIIRHLTGDPPAMARRATRLLRVADRLLLVDVVVAECVYVLESFYEVPRTRVAELVRSALALPKIEVLEVDLLLRALELYEHIQLHFADAYLVAAAELSGVGAITSFDRALDRLPSVERVVP